MRTTVSLNTIPRDGGKSVIYMLLFTCYYSPALCTLQGGVSWKHGVGEGETEQWQPVPEDFSPRFYS